MANTYTKTTKSLRADELDKKWILIDADNLVVGRLSAIIATRLRGKHLPSFTPHMDCGDHVVVINADKVKLTGNKMDDKIYYRHTGHPGGIKQTTPSELMKKGQAPRVIEQAVRRMLPRTTLGRKQIKHLRVYAGPAHPHKAQKLEVLDVASLNPKNKIGSI